MSNNDVQISKALSWLLRHAAVSEGLEISPEGYVRVRDVLSHRRLRNFRCTVEDVERLVQANNKQRFKLLKDDEGELHIKANQGHSIQHIDNTDLVEIRTANEVPLVVHGTYNKCWDAIKRTGLSRMTRRHVHFATGLARDRQVISGMRSNVDLYIYIDLEKALANGIKFYKSLNGVVLSPGDSRGYIEPQYFLKVVLARTGKQIQF